MSRPSGIYNIYLLIFVYSARADAATTHYISLVDEHYGGKVCDNKCEVPENDEYPEETERLNTWYARKARGCHAQHGLLPISLRSQALHVYWLMGLLRLLRLLLLLLL